MPSDVDPPVEAVPAPLLELTGLEIAYGDTTVVHGVDLRLDRGERVAIVGESGSGKSTTAAAVIGLLPGRGRVVGGTIRFDGEDITHADGPTMRRLRGRRIGLVPQDPMSNLNPVTRVGQQITETLSAHGVATGADARRRAVELMSEAGIDQADRRFKQFPHEFSGGMRQRVLIAIALACEPDLLIADEPTSALDVTVQQRILDHLVSLCAARGTALLLITHDLGLAADRAERVVVMSEGRVVETGPADRILTAPTDDYTKALVAAAPSVAAVRAQGSSAQADHGTTGRHRGEPAPAPAADGVPSGPDGPDDAGTPVLSVRDLVKQYRIRGRGGTVLAVDHVSFEVPAGSTLAIVGESGSGKTTTARLVLGLETPTEGEVRIDGTAVEAARGRDRRAIRRAVQPVFQDPYASLDPTSTIERLIDEPLRVLGTDSHPDRRARATRVAELLDQVRLPRATAQRRPGELSGGQRQRVAIARALALQPRLVVCDEAVSALDVLVQDQILQLLGDLQRDLGLAYLFISHDLAVVRQVARDVLVMRAGEVVEAGPTEQVFAAPTDAYTRELLDAIPGRSAVA